MATRTKIGHALAKVLRIDLDRSNESDPITRGESVFSISSADTYVEEEPTIWDWIREYTPTLHDVLLYFYNLFPFTHWIARYNVQWLYGDLVAGITVGAVVVPQSMAYAKLAEVPVQFGLYSSFMGVLIYWFFATSKDITIGPVAVLSTVTGNVVNDAAKSLPNVQGHDVASALAIISGAIVCFIGLVRLGWLVEFISLAAISAYMTGSALSIAMGQIPTLMGIKGFDTRAATYKVFINTLKHLGRSNYSAAMGLTALFMLYFIRWFCNFMAKKQPNHRKMWFFVSTLRTAFVILLYTLISWLTNRHHKKKPTFAILGPVPRGFKDAGVPTIDTTIISAFSSQLPAVVIVMLIEHIAIAKSFGRVNNYTINPSQELVAIGVSNLLGPFLGAYPATGSFSRTAIKSKAGVRTPLAGLITAIVVLLAIYALPAVFFYIPSASLSAVIIHAVGDLITPPNTVYKFWRVSPLEVIIFFAGVFVIVFSSIENGVYTVISCSAALFLYRAFKAQGRFLGKVKVHSVIGDQYLEGNEGKGFTHNQAGKLGGSDDTAEYRNAFIPIDHGDGSNPAIPIEDPYPGIFIFRFSESFNYPNASRYLDYLVQTIFKKTRRTNPDSFPRPGDRPWNDPGPRRGQPAVVDESLPILKAVILDFSTVNNVDITSVQTLIDIRNQLDRYTAPETVEWHFASVNNRWTKRALASAGFGYPAPEELNGEVTRWKPIFSVADIGGFDSAEKQAAWVDRERRISQLGKTDDVEHAQSISQSSAEDIKTARARTSQKQALVSSINKPLFHIDLTAALQSAIENAEARKAVGHPEIVPEVNVPVERVGDV